jgi:ABC-type dipeptide/oligopeptide/nickel transport system ATPase component
MWAEEPNPAALAAKADPDQGCPFAARCPHTFEPCLQTAPPFYLTSPDQAATCYLHQAAPALPLEEMDQLLLKGGVYQTS